MDIVVIGTGGLAREFSSFFSSEVNIVGFSSTNTNEFNDFSLPGEFFGSDITPDIVGTKYAVLAIGNFAFFAHLSSWESSCLVLMVIGFSARLAHPT